MAAPLFAAASKDSTWEPSLFHREEKDSTVSKIDPVFPVTNEDMHRGVYPKLRDSTVCGNTFVGVSGLQNLFLFACRPAGVDKLVIIDPSRFQKRYWKVIQRAVLESEKGPEAASRLFDLARDASISSGYSI